MIPKNPAPSKTKKKKAIGKNKAKERINKYFAEYEVYTDKLSNVCRQLAFAEGGDFWILKPPSGHITTIIGLGLFSLVLYFIFDALQYYFGKTDYEKLAENYRKKLKNNQNLKLSEIKKGDVNKRLEYCFHVKIFWIVITSFLLAACFLTKFFC